MSVARAARVARALHHLLEQPPPQGRSSSEPRAVRPAVGARQERPLFRSPEHRTGASPTPSGRGSTGVGAGRVDKGKSLPKDLFLRASEDPRTPCVTDKGYRSQHVQPFRPRDRCRRTGAEGARPPRGPAGRAVVPDPLPPRKDLLRTGDGLGTSRDGTREVSSPVGTPFVGRPGLLRRSHVSMGWTNTRPNHLGPAGRSGGPCCTGV